METVKMNGENFAMIQSMQDIKQLAEEVGLYVDFNKGWIEIGRESTESVYFSIQVEDGENLEEIVKNICSKCESFDIEEEAEAVAGELWGTNMEHLKENASEIKQMLMELKEELKHCVIKENEKINTIQEYESKRYIERGHNEEYLDFDKTEDNWRFIGKLLGEVPAYLNAFPFSVVQEAIDSIKSHDYYLWEVTGDLIYDECTILMNRDLNQCILREFEQYHLLDDNSISEADKSILEEGYESIRTQEIEIITVNDGDIVESIGINPDLTEKEYQFLQTLQKHCTVLEETLGYIQGDIDGLDLINLQNQPTKEER